MSQINVTRSSMPTYEEYCEEIKELWESRWLTNNGTKHKTLEAGLKEYMQTPNITLYTNGHLALENALNVFDLEGEVITTPYTFASTTQAIVRNRLMPVFCDVREDDYTIDADKIEALITEKTSAIVGVHVYGNLCEVDKIQKIADKYNLKVIYDAAHAFGVSKNGVSAATFGDISMFSFHATKVFHTIEGGCLTYGDSKYTAKLNALKFYGMYENGEYSEVGSNAKMTEFAAAMGLCNLRHVNDEIAKRGEAAARYYERLSDIKGIKLNIKQAGVTPNYAYFPMVFDGYKYTRDQVFEILKAHEITARKYFYPLTNTFACYKDFPSFGDKKTPVAKYISERVLCLPLYADLSISEVDMICDLLLK